MKLIALIIFSIILFVVLCIIAKASSNNRDRYNFLWEGFEKDVKEKKDVQ